MTTGNFGRDRNLNSTTGETGVLAGQLLMRLLADLTKVRNMDDTEMQRNIAAAEREALEQFKNPIVQSVINQTRHAGSQIKKQKMLTKGSFKHQLFIKIINVLNAYDISITGDNLKIHHGGKSYFVSGNNLPKCNGDFYS